MITPQQRAKENKKSKVIIYSIIAVLGLFLSMQTLRAYLISDGSLTDTNKILAQNLNSFNIFFLPNDFKYLELIGIALFIYIIAITLVLTDDTVSLPKRQQKGSAEWADVKSSYKYREKEQTDNIIFTQNVQISMNSEKTGLNNNSLIMGASQSGKTFRFISPNLLNIGKENIVVNDVKGEILIMHGKHLIEKGYDVRVLNTKNMKKSLRFNPLAYIRNESDILSIAKMLSEALGDRGNSGGNDQFWKSAKENLIISCIAYIWERRENYPEEFNLPHVNDLLRMSEEKKLPNGTVIESDFDKIFGVYSTAHPTSLCSRAYGNFKMNKGETRSNVLTTLSSMLSCLDIEEARQLLGGEDEMHIEELATKEKIAIFLCSSDTDSTWNFIITLAIALGLNKVSDIRDENPEIGVPVVFWLDEFANGCRIKDCDKIVSVCSSRRIAMKIIIQSITQLEKLYKDEWKIIIENCATTLVLGAVGDSATYVSKRLGNQTLDIDSTSETKQSKGGSRSINHNVDKRELLTPDEVERLKNDAIIMIRGEQPIIDHKYRTQLDPRFKLMGYVKKGHDFERNFFFKPESYRKWKKECENKDNQERDEVA